MNVCGYWKEYGKRIGEYCSKEDRKCSCSGMKENCDFNHFNSSIESSPKTKAKVKV